MLGFWSQLLIWWEVEVARPVHNFPVRIVRLFSAEWWPADQALKHDRADTPPITPEIVALAAKDLRRDVIRSTNSRVRELAPRLPPSVDLVAVGDCELNLIDRDRIAVLLGYRFGSRLRHELLIVRG